MSAETVAIYGMAAFAAEVIRPAASEWDEREETPWPIIAEAALAASGTPEQLGEFLPQMFGSPGDPKVAAPVRRSARWPWVSRAAR